MGKDNALAKWVCAILLFGSLTACDKDPLDCFEIAPTYCSAQREFMAFDVEGARYRFCQQTRPGDSLFFMDFRMETSPDGDARDDVFSIPQLFTVYFRIPDNKEAFLSGEYLGARPFGQSDEPLSMDLLFIEDCRDVFHSPTLPGGAKGFHVVTSIDLLSTEFDGTDTLSRFLVKGGFEAVLSREAVNGNAKRTVHNGRYSLVFSLKK